MRLILAFSMLLASNVLSAMTHSHSDLPNSDDLGSLDNKPATDIAYICELLASIDLGEVKNKFLELDPPQPPEYNPPSTYSYYPVKHNHQMDLAPFNLNGSFLVSYKSWFIGYAHRVNDCIFESRKIAAEIYRGYGVDLDHTQINRQGKKLIFDYCSANFKGFNIFLWRTEDNTFKHLTKESEVTYKVRNFLKLNSFN
ncbi:MAG: hypothetical protein HRU09_20415 [Oligoflexales bacterium]|nr:hypothetical protein [Oligoflexales bacterium]